jgi:hypothetical protein
LGRRLLSRLDGPQRTRIQQQQQAQKRGGEKAVTSDEWRVTSRKTQSRIPGAESSMQQVRAV